MAFKKSIKEAKPSSIKTPPGLPKGMEELVEALAIDRTDLESCLINQSVMFYQIAEKATAAGGRRDSLKLQMDELHAKLDGEIRSRAADNGEKTTETGIGYEIKANKEYALLMQEHSDTRTEGEHLIALKEAFIQRSYMLRELVALELRRMSLDSDLAHAERSATSIRRAAGDVNAERADKLRQQRRQERK